MSQSQNNKPANIFTSTENKGKRLDQFLAALTDDYSRTFFQKLIKNGKVLIDGTPILSPKFPIANNTTITIQWPQENTKTITAEDFDLPIIYEDHEMLVINKPAGIVVHPANGNWTGTVVNSLLGHNRQFSENFAEELNDEELALRPGIIHRLDKETSGCLIIAKNPQSKKKLSESFANRQVKKTYAALVIGHPSREKEKIETLIGRHPVNRKKMAVVDKKGKIAVTIYGVTKRGKIAGTKVSLLSIDILTGRTHQIRVHLSHKKLPVLGDKIYGGNQKIPAGRQMLHAWKISIPHPSTGKMISFTCPFPDDFENLLNEF